MAVGNPWFSAVEQTLPQYVPIPFEQLAAAGQAIQSRYDTNMGALDQMATGLASIEARLPAHQQYVSQYANRFRQEADELLSRYNYNAADPQFGRELTRLRSRYANDRNLQTISLANQLYDSNLKTRQKLLETGQRFIDTTGRATGVDPTTGQLTADVGSIRATNYDEDLRTMFRDTLQATINDGKGRVSNESAVTSAVNNLMAGGVNNPVIREGIQYYMSQGMTPEDAQKQIQLDIQREATSALTSDIDWGYDASRRGWANLALSREKFNYEKAKEEVKTAPEPRLIRQQAALLGENVNKNLLNRVNSLIDNLDKSGRLLGRAQQVENTEENRRKYPNARPRIIGGGPGYGGLGNYTDVLRVPKSGEASAEDKQFVRAAADEISPILQARGINPSTASDETILKVYKEYIKEDNKAPVFWNHPVKEVRDGLLYIFSGDNGAGLQNAVLVDKDGNNKRVSDGVKVGNYEGFTFGGVGAAPIKDDLINLETGAIKINAVDKESKELVSFLVPLTENMKETVPTVNLVSRVTSSGLDNVELRKDQSYRFGEFVNPSTGQRTSLAPQKKAGRVEFYPVDDQGNIVGEKVDDQQVMILIQTELQNLQSQMENMQNTH